MARKDGHPSSPRPQGKDEMDSTSTGADELLCLFPNGGVECHSWLPVHIDIAGLEFAINFCAICAAPLWEHLEATPLDTNGEPPWHGN